MEYMREVEPRMGVRVGDPRDIVLGVKSPWPISGLGLRGFIQVSKGHGHLEAVAWVDDDCAEGSVAVD